MSWRFIHHAAWCVTSLAFVVGIHCPVSAQFVDLDEVTADADQADASENEELFDLAPTEQPFESPEAPVKPVAKPQPVATEASDTNEEKLAPVVDKNRLETTKLEPVPMPELQAKPSKPTSSSEDESELASPTNESATVPEDQVATESDPLEAFATYRDSSALDASVALEPSNFKQIQPGVSTRDDVLKIWGEPVKTVEATDEDSSQLTYQMPLYRQIDVRVDEADVVVSITVHLEEPQKISVINKELGLQGLVAVPIPDEHGEILGQAYPECGVLLGFSDGLKSLRVAAILLEPLSGEMFRLRAQYDFGHRYEQSLVDLDQAIQLDPDDAESHWLRSQYLDLMGQTHEGLLAVQKAIRLKPTESRYRLTRARLYAKTNRLRSGIDEVKEVIRELNLSPELAGRAHNLLGDMYAIGHKADHQEALKYHLKAIDYAVEAVSDERFAVRRAAKHVLVNAHTSVARDIAMGNFQRQSEVVPKWLLRATELADEFITDDQGDDLLQMQIFRDTLGSYAELGLKTSNFDAAVAIDEAMKTAREMIGSASDRYYEIQVERMLAEALFHAAKLHRNHGQYDTALKFANNALALLDSSSEKWDLVAHDHYLEGHLLFLVGSVYAVRDSNHFEAVDYYGKARELFAKAPGFTSPLYSDRTHGEMCVSMGLSYWETDNQDEAIQLTLQGATIMKDAVEGGTLDIEAMAVPYGNLAAMHSERGNRSKSEEFAKLAAKIDDADTKRR